MADKMEEKEKKEKKAPEQIVKDILEASAQHPKPADVRYQYGTAGVS